MAEDFTLPYGTLGDAWWRGAVGGDSDTPAPRSGTVTDNDGFRFDWTLRVEEEVTVLTARTPDTAYSRSLRIAKPTKGMILAGAMRLKRQLVASALSVATNEEPAWLRVWRQAQAGSSLLGARPANSSGVPVNAGGVASGNNSGFYPVAQNTWWWVPPQMMLNITPQGDVKKDEPEAPKPVEIAKKRKMEIE